MGLTVMTPELPMTAATLLRNDIDDADSGEELDTADDLLEPLLPPIELALSAEDCGIRLDKVLSRLVPQYSRSRIQQWIDAGYVTIDGDVA